jgi:hypothetical protein
MLEYENIPLNSEEIYQCPKIGGRVDLEDPGVAKNISSRFHMGNSGEEKLLVFCRVRFDFCTHN